MDDRIRVMLVDDHAVVRAGVRAMLGSATDIVVVAECADGPSAVRQVGGEPPPDVVIMDLAMGGGLEGLTATREILALAPETKVLILTMHAEEDYLLAALRAGAWGYVVKSAADRELVDAVRALAHGGMYVQPRAARVLAGHVRSNAPGAEERRLLDTLSDREREVLRGVAEGYSAPMIAEALEISAKTVETYKHRIGEKLHLAGRPEFVRFALRAGLLHTEGAATTTVLS